MTSSFPNVGSARPSIDGLLGRRVTISVLIPTYRRPRELDRCIIALARQTRPPDEVVVVVRDGDRETEEFLAHRSPGRFQLRVVTVRETGVIAALNAGLAMIDSQIVAFTDDDAAPRAEWLARIEQHFLSDPGLVGVGGRDWIPDFARFSGRADVGRLQWWGRWVGNHHLGVGPPREVDVLKGVNMSFRRSVLAGRGFDRRLLGSGAQVHFELSFCLEQRRAGRRLLYDPEVAVDHLLAPRFDEDQRDRFSPKPLSDAVHNETLALLEHLSGIRRVAFALWALAVGTLASPGAVQWLRFILTGEPSPTGRLLAAWQGRAAAYRTWRRSKRTRDECAAKPVDA